MSSGAEILAPPDRLGEAGPEPKTQNVGAPVVMLLAVHEPARPRGHNAGAAAV